MSKWMNGKDVLEAITANLDRINGTAQGTMKGVAYDWLKDIETVEMEDVE